MTAVELDPRAKREAIAWFVRLSSGEATERERADWSAWRAADPAHEQAWTRIDGVSRSIGALPGSLASPTLRRAEPRRRTVLRSIAGLGGTAALGYGLYAGGRRMGWDPLRDEVGGWSATLLADLRTGVGEQRRVELSDGSVLTLNTASAVDVRYDSVTRAIRLHEGEIHIETAKERRAQGADDARPLVVATRLAKVRALGTRFLVRAEEERVGVAVLSGAVEAHTRGGMLERIDAHEQVAISALGLEPVRPLTAEADAWVDGSLIVDNARLDEVIAELARYRRGPLSCDPAVGALRVSGAFPVRDVDQALTALSAALPVRVDRWGGFWTTVKPRSA